MQFLFYFAVCLGSFLLSLQLFTSTTTQKGPAEDLFFAQFHRQAEASRPYSTQSPATKPAAAPKRQQSTRDVSAAPPERCRQLRPRRQQLRPRRQQLRPRRQQLRPTDDSYARRPRGRWPGEDPVGS